jgi:hypothetical protein
VFILCSLFPDLEERENNCTEGFGQVFTIFSVETVERREERGGIHRRTNRTADDAAKEEGRWGVYKEAAFFVARYGAGVVLL